MKRPYLKRQYRQSWLVGFTSTVMKYFLLTLAGMTICGVAALALRQYGVAITIELLLRCFLEPALILVGCLWATAVIAESVR